MKICTFSEGETDEFCTFSGGKSDRFYTFSEGETNGFCTFSGGKRWLSAVFERICRFLPGKSANAAALRRQLPMQPPGLQDKRL
jgi:hypothetical protein